ncbi:MAG TPA: DUF808 domain-containing protein [Myxococcales bacterium]|jgi:hypothetical protein
MAGTSLLALLDDITTVLDDVAVMTKVAAKKTAGVLGDDLALNAQQVAGVHADRELPVVWAVAKGSLANKAILVPVALAVSAFVPWGVVPLLMVGGLYLCYEGVEKLAHRLFHSQPEDDAHRDEHQKALQDPAVDLVALEKEKVKGAIRTDFVLSAEIVAITLGSVAQMAFLSRLLVLSGIAVIMTVGVYGFVACIVKLDDLGVFLSERGGARKAVGQALLAFAPWLMKALSVAGTAAMFLVGGGILAHGLGPLEHLVHAWAAAAGPLGWLVTSAADALLGVVAGALALAAVALGQKLAKRLRPAKA